MKRKIYTFGSDARLDFCRSFLEGRAGEGSAVYILPIPSTRDGEKITGTEILLSDFFKGVESGEYVLAYGIPSRFAEELGKKGAALIDASLDEEYLEKGAELTVHGALVRILASQKRSPADLRFGIIGYGRIGRRLAELLTFLGADVTVFTSRIRLREDLGRLGIRAVCNYELPLLRDGGGGLENPLSALDILINCAPARVLSEEDAQYLSGASVFELASGDNIPENIPYLPLPALPAKMFPESAGIAYAQVALRNLFQNK